MLISHRYCFIYTKTVKTAGTSVESYFERFCMPDGGWAPSHGREMYQSDTGVIGFRGGIEPERHLWWNHMPAHQVRGQIGEAVWNAYFKFCVIRNPFDKMASAFFFFDERARALSGPGSEGILREWFLEWLERDARLAFDRDKYVIDGRLSMDAYVRYERLNDDLRDICDRIGVPWDAGLLPSYKSGFRPRQIGLSDLFSAEARSIVESMFAFEIEQFGYAFPR